MLLITFFKSLIELSDCELLFCQGWFQVPSGIFNLASPQLSSHLIKINFPHRIETDDDDFANSAINNGVLKEWSIPGSKVTTPIEMDASP